MSVILWVCAAFRVYHIFISFIIRSLDQHIKHKAVYLLTYLLHGAESLLSS